MLNALSKQQQRLVEAIWTNETNAFNPNGLAIYRGNLSASATRSLSITYPTIQALVGEKFFAALVEKYVKCHPLEGGDWGTWGETFPAWLSQQANLSAYPYLPDCALLDWHCHLAERAPDLEPAQPLTGLSKANIDQVRLQLAVGSQFIRSNYPIVDIWQAHQFSDVESKRDLLALAQQKLANQQAQTALLWRPKWKVHVKQIGKLEADWIAIMLTQQSLLNSLHQLNNPDFSLNNWLPEAFAEGLVCGFYD